MALREIEARLAQRAKVMNNIVDNAYKMIERMKDTIYAEQLKKLKLEKIQLEDEVKSLVSKLVDLENKHGKKQIPIHTVELKNGSALPASSTKNDKNISLVSDSKQDNATPDIPKSKEKTDKPSKKVEKKPPKSKPEGEGDARPVDVSRLDFRIGVIREVSKHPDADSLYVEQIDLGEEKPRTVVSGLVKYVPLEEMQNRSVVVLCNLKPAKMRGILSEAMVMCASTPEKVEILTPPQGCIPGDRIIFDGYSGEPDNQLNPKKKIFEQVAPDLKTDENCVATYRGIPFMVKDKGIVKAATLANVIIK